MISLQNKFGILERDQMIHAHSADLWTGKETAIRSRSSGHLL